MHKIPPPSQATALSRRKKHRRWTQLDESRDGYYNRSLLALAERLREHKLTVTEHRVCVLLRETRTSVEIAEILGIDERSVERYRTRIHKKLGLQHRVRLAPHLLSIS